MSTSQSLKPHLNWASVASWFFKPDQPIMTTMANTEGISKESERIAAEKSKIPDTKTEPAEDKPFQVPKICTAIRCTVPGCNCECFVPGKKFLRCCETCQHGWVPHALDKLGTRHLFSNSTPEPVLPNAAFDIASLVLYGCQAVSIRLKILLDRLFSVLQKNQVVQVLHGFGWTTQDYARGYILKENTGSTLDRWSICTPEEEPLVLQQFLRFGETRAITQQLLLAQQALQDPNLERLERRLSSRGAMSPNRRPSPPTAPSAAFHHHHHLSRLHQPSTMSPHQKLPLNFMKMPVTNGPVSTHSPPRSISTSPLDTSPLNRLQSMQPFDFRKLANFSSRLSPELSSRRRSESESMGLNLSMTSTSLANCLPPLPLPPPPVPSSLANHPAVAMAAAAATANSLAAASLVASTFPGLMSSARLSTGSKSPSSSEINSANNNSDDDDDMPDNGDENSYSALNLSRDRSGSRLRTPGRKLSTPTKRQWTSPSMPLNLGTQFINPATGKKRVQCNVCLKTFCDKGALKIHFSAVHLREMHKCTVEGCNMMFSSRRSRNRHSANPNPKLHSPHLRRKISPHDGRSAHAHPLLIPPQSGLSLPSASALSPLNPFSPFPLLTPPPDMRHHSMSMDFKKSLDLSLPRTFEHPKTVNSQSEEDEDDDDDGIVVVGGDEDDEHEKELDKQESFNGAQSDQPEDFSMPAKRQKITCVSDGDEDNASNVDSNEDSLSVNDSHSVKDELSVQTNKRKRKSQNPTRCTVPISDTTSDNDSSNDMFSENVSRKFSEILEDDPPLIKPKLEEERCDSAPLDLGKHSPDVNANEPEPEKNTEIKTSLAPLFMNDKIKKEKSQEIDIVEDERPGSSVESNKSDESFDSSSNALRHLESLSHGHLGDLMARGLHLGLGQTPSQFPPLSFMIGGGPPSPARSQTSSVSSSNESPDENSQNQLFGHFDNGQFISTMDVPIDKDNPRRCTACGKIFQNHFGVKTHYQNVHLKLMHKCNVDGCNAAFPSKRSRDRHSANLNLHRKLLSTSSDKSAASLLLEKSPFATLAANPSLHSEFLTRLYAEEALKNHHIPPPNLDQLMLNGDRIPPPPLLLPPLGGLPFSLGNFNHFTHGFNNGSLVSLKDRSSSPGSSPPPASPTMSSYVHCIEEDMPTPDKEGKLPCRLCRIAFNAPSQLKEHCEKNHLPDMFKCNVPNCCKVFVSRTRRNIHSENDSLHVNLARKNSDRS